MRIRSTISSKSRKKWASLIRVSSTYILGIACSRIESSKSIGNKIDTICPGHFQARRITLGMDATGTFLLSCRPSVVKVPVLSPREKQARQKWRCAMHNEYAFSWCVCFGNRPDRIQKQLSFLIATEPWNHFSGKNRTTQASSK